MFRKYFFLAKVISVSRKTKKVFSQKYQPLFHIHRTIFKGVWGAGRRREKALTYVSPNATFI